MDVKNCSTESQATLYNFGGHYYQQILIYSLAVYSSLLSQVAIYSKKSLLGPLKRYGPQITSTLNQSIKYKMLQGVWGSASNFIRVFYPFLVKRGGGLL